MSASQCPFIILSGYAGQFADRNSKRYVSVMVKVLEIPIALVGLVGFWLGQLVDHAARPDRLDVPEHSLDRPSTA